MYEPVIVYSLYDLAVGITCMILLYLLKWAKEKFSKKKSTDSQKQTYFKTVSSPFGTCFKSILKDCLYDWGKINCVSLE